MKLAGSLVVAALVSPAAVAAGPMQRTLTFDERVAAQTAIEQVYWSHRVWPKENPTPKPPLSAVMSDDAIRAKVHDYLKKSSALEKYWRRPVTADQLQAEVDRMAKHTRDGQILSELFTALGNDPVLIAETLARPTLADRLIRSWYASDTRFHGALKARASAALAACASADCMKSIGGEYRETTWKRRVDPADEANDSAMALDGDEWSSLVARLAARLGASGRQLLPNRRLSRLEETPEAFGVTAVLSQREGEITTASVVWPKTSFETWWNAERPTLEPGITAAYGALSLVVPAVGGCVDDTWGPMVAPMEPRTSHSAVWTGTEMIVWGGFGDGSSPTFYLNTGGRYNPSTDTWVVTSTGANVPVGRNDHTAVWTGTQMIIWGGSADGNGGGLNTGGRYDPSTDSWLATSTGANVPQARAFHTAVWTGTEMIVWGAHGNSPDLNTGGRYNPVTDSWVSTSVGANTPEARHAHTAVWTGTEMIVWGGQHFAFLNNGGRYNPATDAWVPTSTGVNVPEQRFQHSAVWTGTQMIVWGGEDVFGGTGHYLNTGGRYDPSTDTWASTSTGANVAPGRHSHAAVWTGSEMIIWGGDNVTGGSRQSGGRYNPSTDSWLATSTGANVPFGRFADTAVWTGTEMIIWGGSIGITVNTGGRYNPSTDSWVPTSTGADLPVARKLHTAVWIGAEMIVWGGRGGSPDYLLLNSGGRYNTATDSWTATSTGPNVPDAREQHTAVWTGTQMIVFGGAPYAVTDSGGRYNPSTDTWLATSGSSVPSGRFLHTAVWTGSEMIVWGGFLDDTEFNTGGRYNPSTNTWAATSTGANVPTGRHFHSAIWTGTEMIIWGGLSGTDLNTGGRYTPSTNSWVATSTGTNVPFAREQHTAVWTGTAMIVWGGRAGSATNTGGRYDPSTNSWTATSTGANVPDARSGHAAVWTGREMLAWGGGLFAGGRYNASSDSWAPTSTGQYAPVARSENTAVWTGAELIVWGGGGGNQVWNIGGRYCACLDPVTYYRDADGDGRGDAAASTTACNSVIPAGYVAGNNDCNDAAVTVWSIPTEARSLSFSSQAALGWTPPLDPGGSATRYDTIRSGVPSNFNAVATCVESDGDDTATTDLAKPALGTAFYYLVRAETSCGTGSLGQASGGVERSGRICP